MATLNVQAHGHSQLSGGSVIAVTTACPIRYFGVMNTPPTAADRGCTVGRETEAERRARFEWEADCIAEARARSDAGLTVDAAKMRAWVETTGTDYELPPAPTRHR